MHQLQEKVGAIKENVQGHGLHQSSNADLVQVLCKIAIQS